MVLGEKGHLFQGNRGTKPNFLGEQRQYWGTENIRTVFLFSGNKQIYFRGTKDQVPPGRTSFWGNRCPFTTQNSDHLRIEITILRLYRMISIFIFTCPIDARSGLLAGHGSVTIFIPENPRT